MIKKFACTSNLYFGADLLMFESAGYLSGAVRQNLTRSAVGVWCLLCEYVAFRSLTCFCY